MPNQTIQGFIQINTGTVQRDNMDITTPTKSMIRKIISGSNLSMQYTGADPGTGDVTLGVTDQIIQGLASGTYTEIDGWIYNEGLGSVSWGFNLADPPSYVIWEAEELITGTISVGMKVRFTQHGSIRQFFVTKIAVSGTTTFVTLYGGTNYSVSSTGTISQFNYSTAKSPLGFPTNPDNWTETFSQSTNQSTGTPTADNWINLGQAQLSVPIGAWFLMYDVALQSSITLGAVGSVGARATLSTAPNTASDGDFTNGYLMFSPAGSVVHRLTVLPIPKNVVVSTKTIYYLNALSSQSLSAMAYRGDTETTKIKAVCAYL